MLIDTHCHLNLKDFENDYDAVIKTANEAGVEKIIIVGDDLPSSQKAVEIAQKYDQCFAAIGIHPYNANQLKNGWEDELKNLAQQKKVVAIGEIGLDYYGQEGELLPNPEIQKQIFQKQMDLAKELKLPIIFHSRESAEDMFSLIKSPISGVFHCYAAGKKGIKKVEELGLLFGVDGNLTYDQGLQNVVSQIPLEKIILETDSPWLTPVPFRGKRNEPKNVTLINECLAKIKNVSKNEAAKITSQNAIHLFNL